MPALTATQPTTGIQPAEDLVWMRPSRGFDAWVVRRDLEAADPVLDDWNQESGARQGLCTALSDGLATENDSLRPGVCDRSGTALRAGLARGLSFFCFATLPVAAGLVLGSFSGDHHRLWDWGLATMVVGQMALLLASLVDRKD
jgi:hypothetical protein